MSLTELAEKSGVQIATLSRIENQKMTGTLESHIQIAQAFGIDLTELYQDVKTETKHENKIEVLSNESLADVFNYNEKSSYEILTNKILTKKMMPTLLRVDPGGQTNIEVCQKTSEKFVFVLEGTLCVKIADKSYDLSPKNSLYFSADEKHQFINNSQSLAKAIVIVSPVQL